MTTVHTEAIQGIAPDLEYAAEFVPQSKSRNAGEKRPSLNWLVTLRTPRGELRTDYMQGIGHLPGYKYPRDGSIAATEYQRKASETGKYATTASAADGAGMFGLQKTIPAPDLADVLHCLLLDGEAIDAGGFEEWAGDFGYDTDSRKAESMYRSCVETGLKLRRMFGDETVQRLRDALQDL